MSFTVRKNEKGIENFKRLKEPYPDRDWDRDFDNWVKYETKDDPRNYVVITKIIRLLTDSDEDVLIYNDTVYRVNYFNVLTSKPRSNLGISLNGKNNVVTKIHPLGHPITAEEGIAETWLDFDIPFSKENLDILMKLATGKGREKCKYALMRERELRPFEVEKDVLYVEGFENAWNEGIRRWKIRNPEVSTVRVETTGNSLSSPSPSTSPPLTNNEKLTQKPARG